MSERLILKKSVRKGSLVRRILWGAVLFVIFPLFLHTIFLYFSDYQGDIKTVRGFLQIVQQDKVDLLEEIIFEKKEFLKEGSFFQLERIQPDRQGDPFFTRVDAERPILWVGRNLSSFEAVGLAIDLDAWWEKWKYLEQYEYPLFISIQDAEGRLVAGEPFDVNEKHVMVRELIGDTGLVFIISVPMKAIQLYEVRYYASSVFILLGLIGVIGGGGVILFARRISRPFVALCRTMERVSEGAFHVRYQPDKMGYEINVLGEQLNVMLDELLRRTEEVEKERIHRERLAQELAIGRSIQRSLLPLQIPTFSGLDIAPGYLPAQEVSGDFYDLFPIDEHRFLFMVADSAGKGISACLYGLGFRSALRACARKATDLSDVIKKVNELLLLDTLDSGFFITAWIGIYDAENGTLQYCSQGHPPALLKRGSSLQYLTTDSMAFGVENLTSYPVQEIKLFDHDVLLLYTDGILEAHHTHGNFFGMQRLQDFLLAFPFSSSSSLVSSLLTTIEQFSQETVQYDDITLLVIKFSIE